MADYKAMYLAAMDAMERAIETLTAAQQRCEDLYVATSGLVDDVPLEHVRPFALGFAGEMEAEHPDVVAEIESWVGGGGGVKNRRCRTRSVRPWFQDVLRLTQTGHPSCAAALSA